jgi:regulatory protein YycI of two-component signal transduction system YycFG
MSKRTMNILIVILLILAVGFISLIVLQQVNTATANLDTVLTETILTRTAIAGMGD